MLIAKEDRPLWESLVQQLGYSVFHDGGTFLQLSPANGAGWELDLMLVSRQTLEKMLAEAQVSDNGGAPVLIPSLAHLLALKIHALKHGQGARALKDLNDVLELVSANHLDVRADSFRALFEKHGDMTLYERVLQASRH